MNRPNWRQVYALVVFTVTLITAIPVYAEGTPLFYRGAFDDKVGESPNGARVNEDYIKWAQHPDYGAGPVVHKPREGVWSISGYSISNYTFVEGDTGLIVFDTGNNIGMGQAVLKIIREHTDKPVSAIIYSHHHYTGGAGVFAGASASGEVPVYGHPDVDRNLVSSAAVLGPMQARRTGIQLGAYLPHNGPDAVFGPPNPVFTDPELSATAHLSVTHPMADGEQAVIDGQRVIFYHAVSDTRDSVIVHFPDIDLALHNTAVAPLAFSLYTLRGDFYRAPGDMIASIDKLREIDAEVVIGASGGPLVGDEAERISTLHRDAYAFVYNQSIRGINKGLTADQLVETVRLPRHLTEDPWIFPAYVDWEYNVRGQYRGIIGWFGEDTADLHPPTPNELGAVIVEMAGGADKIIARAQRAFDEKAYNLAAKLMSQVLAAEPGNFKAKQLKANALRHMAQTTRSGIQTRNFMLTEALHLEGKLDWYGAPQVSFYGEPSPENILSTPPGTYLKILETNIDPKLSADVERVAKVTFSDLNRSWSLHVRRGVAEVSAVVPDEVDVTISLPRLTWAAIVIHQKTLAQAVQTGEATISGDREAMREMLDSFGVVSTTWPEKEDMH